VSKQYYADELKYDAKMLAENNTVKLSKVLSVKNNGDLLSIQFPNTPESGAIHLYRPSESDMDKDIKIVGGRAEQTFSIATLQTGLWIAKIEWKSDNTTFYAEQRFTK
jgi:nitrogen fixation protein FixH